MGSTCFSGLALTINYDSYANFLIMEEKLLEKGVVDDYSAFRNYAATTKFGASLKHAFLLPSI